MKDRLPQLWFPIQKGISDTDHYRKVTRRGERPDGTNEAPGLKLRSPDLLKVMVAETPAGGVPLFTTGTREDFVSLVQALAHSNEPVAVPPSSN